MACGGCDNLLRPFFLNHTDSIHSIKDFLVSHGVIRDHINCPECGTRCNLRFCPSGRWSFRCSKGTRRRRCTFNRSARMDTFVGASRLSMEQLLTFCAFWCLLPSPRHRTLVQETQMSEGSVVDWSGFCREVCLGWAYENSRKIGGPDAIVEIDYSKFGLGRRSCREIVGGEGIYGGVERGNPKNFFIVSVENENAETLIEVIKQWILPGTTIISNCWKAYDTLKDEGFVHLRVNNSLEFVDTPDSDEIPRENRKQPAGQQLSEHTQNIQKKCRSLKYSVPVFGCRKANFEGHFAEHMFKTNIPRSRLICEFFKRAGMFRPPPL